MFYEYALEPAAINSWERARYLLEGFGAPSGRFLARVPHTWPRAVLDGLRCGDLERKRIEAKLEQLARGRAFSARSVGDSAVFRTWIEHALSEHQKAAFRAIIASVEGVHPVLSADAVSDSEPLWRVEHGQFLLREPRVFADALGLLLRSSRHLVVIDPYFRPNHSSKTRVLAACSSAGLAPGAQLSVHASLSAEHSPSYAAIKQDALRLLPRLLPRGLKVSLYFWLARPGGYRFHNRYMVTEVGGVQFGDSIESGASEQKDRLSILDEASRLQLWHEFVIAPPRLDPAGPAISLLGSR